MAWSDEPTEAQLGTIYHWLRWIMPVEDANDAVAWLEKTATRQDVSAEMVRLKTLKDKRLLDGNTCFKSEIWEGYHYE